MHSETELTPVSPEALAAFQTQRMTIVQTVVAHALERQNEVVQHGEQAAHLLTIGLDFTTQALEVAMRLHNTTMLDDQLQWANERLPHDGVQPEHLLVRFEILAQVVDAILPLQHAAAINGFVRWMAVRQRELIRSGMKGS